MRKNLNSPEEMRMSSRLLQRLTNAFIVLFFFTCQIFHSGFVRAGSVFSDAVWQSSEIDGATLGSAMADVNGDGGRDIVTLSRKRAVVFSLAMDGSLAPFATIPSEEGEEFYRVFAGDFNRDGQAEILLNGFAREQPFSRIVAVRDGQPVALQQFPSLVAPLLWQGEERLFSQTMRGRGEWGQVLSILEWQNGSYRLSQSGIRIASGVGTNPISLFSVTGLGDKLAILTDDGFLVVTDDAGKKIWRSGLRYGGALDMVVFEGKDPLGMKRKAELQIAPRLAVLRGGNVIVVPKNVGILPAAVGAFSGTKAAQYSVLEWTEGGFQEREASPKYDGAISDVQAADYDGDGIENEILLTLWTRGGGMLETSLPKKSLLTVVPSGFPGGFVPPFALPQTPLPPALPPVMPTGTPEF